MILRQLAESLKQRDWGAALTEIGIVVVGIFIGLQVDDWNNTRKDRALEREYLERLQEDIGTLVPLQADRLALRTGILSDLEAAADVLIGEAPESAWVQDHCVAIENSHIFSPLRVAVPVLNEMMATGRVSLIEDVRLRDALSRLQIQVARSSELTTRLDASTRVLARVYPAAIQGTIARATEPEFGPHDFVPRCDLEAMRSDPDFLSDLADNYSRYTAYISVGLRETHERFLDVKALLDERLGTFHANAE